MKSASSRRRPDYLLLSLVFVMVVFGLVALASASSNLGEVQFHDTYYYLRHQIYFGLSLGILGFAAAYFIPYASYRKWAVVLLALSIVLLALVFTRLSSGIQNTDRWLRLGPLTFQPAEILKLTYILYLAAWLSNPRKRRAEDFFEGFVPFLVVSGVVALLLVLQPATSTVAILIASGLVVYFVSGAKLRHIALVILIGLAGLALLVFVTPYRMARVTGFFHQSANTQTTNYQLNQALTAIGSGGLSGVGYGQSTLKINFLPAPLDDSIFAIIAEELGFLGAAALIVVLLLMVVRYYRLALKISDRFGKLILVGFGTVIALQAFVNIASISGILPLTGVPLPFVSYGGTALAVFLTMSGIAVNVSRCA